MSFIKFIYTEITPSRETFTSYITFNKNRFGNWELLGNYYVDEKSVFNFGKFLLEEILENRFKEVIIVPEMATDSRELLFISLKFTDKAEEAYFLMWLANRI